MTFIPRWEKYKHFFHIAVFRYLVLWFALVPLIATLLKGLQTPLVLQLDGRTVTIALGLPFSWQLLWLSSFFFFLALALYQLRCPRFAKTYNTFTDYLSYSHDPRWLAWEAVSVTRESSAVKKFADRLRTKRYVEVLPAQFTWKENPLVEERQTKVFFESDGQKLCLGMPVLDANGQVVPEAERGVFWEIFGRFSESRSWSRLSILALLFLSGVCFLVVLLQHIAFGLEELTRWALPDIATVMKWL